VKLAQKRGKDMGKLLEIILLLAEGSLLPPRCKDHLLARRYAGALKNRPNVSLFGSVTRYRTPYLSHKLNYFHISPTTPPQTMHQHAIR
jgi:hypothetical protein